MDAFDFLDEPYKEVNPGYISEAEQEFISKMLAKGGVSLKEARLKNGVNINDGYVISEGFLYGDEIKYVSFYFEDSAYSNYYLNIDSITDRNLKDCIKKKLERETKNLTYLSCNDLIGSLQGLEGAISIGILRLQFNSAIDLSPIAQFNNITELDINLGKDLDLRQVGILKTLKTLSLSQLNVNNSEAIKNLTSLTSLAIYRVNGFDFSVINDLTALKVLSVESEKFDAIDFSKLTQLEELNVIGSDRGNVNLSVLNPLSNLKKLSIYGANIAKLPKLNIHKITELKIVRSKLQDISNITHFKSLKILKLTNNNLAEVPDLGQLTNLEVVDVSKNLLMDISFLEYSNNLKVAYVFNNGLTDLSPIYKLPNLILLHAQGNQITDISGIESMNQLLDLILVGNPIVDCYPATKLKKLIGTHWCEVSE